MKRTNPFVINNNKKPQILKTTKEAEISSSEDEHEEQDQDDVCSIYSKEEAVLADLQEFKDNSLKSSLIFTSTFSSFSSNFNVNDPLAFEDYLCYYIHPATQNSSHTQSWISNLLSNPLKNEEFKIIRDLDSDWILSFNHLIELLDSKMLYCFYYITTSFSILFEYNLATFSNSSPGFLKLLSSKNIIYQTLPKNRISIETPSFKLLIDFLRTWREPRIVDQSKGNPLLISTHLFINSCMKIPVVKTDTVTTSDSFGLKQVHTISFSGYIFPSCIPRIVQDLKKPFTGEFVNSQLFTESVRRVSCLNDQVIWE